MAIFHAVKYFSKTKKHFSYCDSKKSFLNQIIILFKKKKKLYGFFLLYYTLVTYMKKLVLLDLSKIYLPHLN